MLTVSNLLGTLQEDPYDTQAIRDLRDAIASGDPARTGPDGFRLLRLAQTGESPRRLSARESVVS